MKKVAICPGSFDPVTLGHVDVAKRAAAIFGSCIVLVMNNRDKQYRFSMEERFLLCQKAFEGVENVTVEHYEGMLYEYLSERKETAVLVKGIRNEKDFLYEKKMAEFNFRHSSVETLYLDAAEALQDLSSTLVRKKMDQGEDLSAYLPESIVKHLQNKL